MMYHMKNIVTYDGEILLPKCMYHIKNTNESPQDAFDINISNQVIRFIKTKINKMAELEQRQDQLLKKLDILYDRITTIKSLCTQTPVQGLGSDMSKREKVEAVAAPAEIIVVFSPDNLPWCLNILFKETTIPVNISWHIHSSVPNDKVAKIKAFVKKLQINNKNEQVNVRLILKNISADSELRLSSLAVPIVGNVNILRYLSYIYPQVISYDSSDYHVDHLLDLCHVLERAPEKNKEAIINKLFSQYKDWLYGNRFSIVDLAVYNVIKQWQNCPKYVPKAWFDKCEKLCW